MCLYTTMHLIVIYYISMALFHSVCCPVFLPSLSLFLTDVFFCFVRKEFVLPTVTSCLLAGSCLIAQVFSLQYKMPQDSCCCDL